MHALHLPRVLIAAALLLPCGRAAAESVFIVNPPSASPVTGAVNVDVRVVIPTLVLLRVGSSNASGGVPVIDTLNFALPGSILGSGNLNPGNNNPIAWNGTPPGFPASSQQTVNVNFYSNAANNRINCSIGAWTTPVSGSIPLITVAAVAGGTIPHPSTNLNPGACAQTTVPRLSSSATWRFTLGGSLDLLASGTYSTVITYTASTL